ncbi:MAG: hypothetical protein IKT39_01150 [Clostridia bacterium]|nr:hypothetical protein [Clostridia bacterium]
MEKRKLKGSGKWMDNKNLMRIVSLVLAIMLWLYVAVTQDPTRTDRVENVEVICGLSQNQINQGLSIISKSNDTVYFEATGKRSLVTGVRGNYYAKLDLDDITAPGKYNITPDISRPEGVFISGVSPSVIEVYVDKYVSSTLPVVIQTKGKLSGDLVIKDMTADLGQIDVQLPSLALEQIAYIGAVVDLSGISSSSIINCQPVLLDADKEEIELKNIVFDKTNIVVDINVEQIKNVKIMPKVSGMDKYAKGLSVTAVPKSIDLCGDKETLDAISSIETMPFVLQSEVSDGQEFEVKLQLPTGTHLKANTENSIKLVFKK